MKSPLKTANESAAGSVLKRFYSETELAAYAGLSARTLQGWRLFGKGPPWRKLCGSVRYDVTAFDSWAAGQPGGGGTP